MDRRSFLFSSALLPAFSSSASRLPAPAAPTLKPPRLRPGDQVAIVNPAGATAHRVEVEIVTESLQALGLRVKHGRHLLDRHGYLAGTDVERADDLNRQLADPDVRGVVAVRGGWGCARILPLTDFEALARDPKILVGYSDVTALLLAAHARTGLVTFHGPIGLGPWNAFTVDYFRRVLFDSEAVLYRNPERKGDNLVQVQDRIQTIRPGVTQGRLLGGNLTVLTALIGTGYLPDWQGCILFLEDIREEIYRVDRMLTQLKLAGILGQAAGFVFGKCTDCDPAQSYGSLTLDDLFDDHIKPLGIPAFQGAMIGHITEKFTLPVGLPAEIDAAAGTIRLLEPAVVG